MTSGISLNILILYQLEPGTDWQQSSLKTSARSSERPKPDARSRSSCKIRRRPHKNKRKLRPLDCGSRSIRQRLETAKAVIIPQTSPIITPKKLPGLWTTPQVIETVYANPNGRPDEIHVDKDGQLERFSVCTFSWEKSVLIQSKRDNE